MVLRMSEAIATSDFLRAWECTKFVFGGGFASDYWGELTALSRPSSWL